MDSLRQTLNWHNPPSFPCALFFADDGVLISSTLGKAQSLLKEASRWADQHGMAFNIAKCGYLITHTASKAPPAIRPSLQLHNLFIPFVQSYKYLGVTFSSLGSDLVVHGKSFERRCGTPARCNGLVLQYMVSTNPVEYYEEHPATNAGIFPPSPFCPGSMFS